MPLRGFSRTEVLLTERRRLELPLLLLIGLGIAAFCIADGNLFYLAAGLFAVAVNLFVVYRAKEIYIHKFFVYTAVLGATAVLVMEVLFRQAELLQAMGHYLVLIQVCKLFERKKNRDYIQMFSMSLLMFLSTALITDNIFFAFFAAAYMALACYTAMVFTLKRGLDAAGSARLPIEPQPPSPDRVAWNVTRDWPRKPILRRVMLAMVMLPAMGALLFLFMPRARDLAEAVVRRQTGESSTGYSPEVSLGDVQKVYSSDRIVMRMAVQVTGDARFPGKAYLRGQVFDQYAHSRWDKTSYRDPSRYPVEAAAVSAMERNVERRSRRPRVLTSMPAPSLMNDLVVQEIAMSPSLLPTVFAVYPSPKIESDEAIFFSSDLEAIAPPQASTGQQLRYKAYSWPAPLTRRQRQYLTAVRMGSVAETENPRSCVEVPESVAALAKQWCADLLAQREKRPDRRDELDLAVARKIADNLRKNYRYTLDLRSVTPSRDGIEDFLFYTRSGHCEYFASALTAMCCCLDVHARLATGFVAEEYDPINKSYIVRERDAHAWTEVYTPSTDWIVLDATPPGGIRSTGVGLWRRMVNAWENLEFQWYDKVIGYDSRSQTRLQLAAWESVRRTLQRLSQSVEAVGESLVNLLAHGQVDRVLARFALGVVVLGAALEAMLILRLARQSRRRRGWIKLDAQTRRIMNFLPRLLSLLARHGIVLDSGLTLRELADTAEKRLDLPRGLVGDVIELYYRLRWGHIFPREDEIRQAREKMGELRRRLL
jgi:transglutaminase-like putative cysteine protease